MDEWYISSKVYFDGSHYVAIPHTINPYSYKKHRFDIVAVERNNGKYHIVDDIVEKYNLIEINSDFGDKLDNQIYFENLSQTTNDVCKSKIKISRHQLFIDLYEKYKILNENDCKSQILNEMVGLFLSEMRAKNYIERNFEKLMRREIFEKLYIEYLDFTYNQKKEELFKIMRVRFNSDKVALNYVIDNLKRKKRNLILRRMRFVRKAYNQSFNYFVTITYDDKKHNELSFRRKLTYLLNNFSSRKSWRYMGVWERGKETARLHFHGLFYIPDGMLSGKLEVIEDYNYKHHTLRTVTQNTFFLDRFGRNEFEELDNGPMFGRALSYIMKYLEKSGEKIVYSRGLYQYFKSDIQSDDVIAKMGINGRKLVLSDDFNCWNEGVNLGAVSSEAIMQLEKCV